MSSRFCRVATIAAAVSALCFGTADALTVRGYGSIITIPVVVHSASFTSEIYIHNPQGSSVTYAVTFYGGTGTNNPGANACPGISIGANTTAQYSLATLCPGLNFSSSTFGRLYIYELASSNQPFAAYARVNSAQGDGFSIEGFPIGEIDNPWGVSSVQGLKRQASAPGYQTNCFIGSMAETTTVTYGLRTNTGATLGTDQPVSLTANQFVRVVDVFSAVGAPAGDYTNVRAVFTNNNLASFVAFCTVQNNTTFDADFRIAKVYDNSSTNDKSRQFTSSVSVVAGATTDLASNVLPTVNYPSVQHNWAFYVRHPDWVSCALSGVTPSGEGELELVDPSGTVVAGGGCVKSFAETYLGEKTTHNGGTNGRWIVRVGGCLTSTPVTAYTLTCTSGNGTSTFTFGGAKSADF